jgi:hypothetical protein
MKMRDWVRLPTGWIVTGGLANLRWEAQKGADNAAALMSLGVIAHHADDETGVSQITYDQVCAATGLSRAKISAGLKILAEMKLIERRTNGRSSIRLADYDRTKGWGKLPARKMYSAGYIPAFSDFSLRRPAELNALKLYYAVVAFRNNDTNVAQISYDSIEKHTGIDRAKIKGGLNVLAANGLVHIEYLPASTVGHVSNAYRLAHLDPYSHMGTAGRGRAAEDFQPRPLSDGPFDSPPLPPHLAPLVPGNR